MSLFSLYSTLFDDVFGLYSILFDVDSGHDGHSGELPLFEGYYVGKFVSHLICTFTGLSS